MSSEVLDLIPAAAYLGMHPVTLRNLMNRPGNGKPPGRKVGGRWKFLKAALDAYLSPSQPSIDTLPKLVIQRSSDGHLTLRSQKEIDKAYQAEIDKASAHLKQVPDDAPRPKKQSSATRKAK